jgi:hypothetical protein
MSYETNEGKEDRLASGGLDDGRFANASSIEIDICALLCRLCSHIEVKDLHDVANQVG